MTVDGASPSVSGEDLQRAEALLRAKLGDAAPHPSSVPISLEQGRRNIITFGMAAGLNDLGEEMGRPFLPTFAALLGANPFIFGLLVGLEEVVNRLLRPFGGVYSDRTGRRQPVMMGYLLIGVYRLGIAASRVWTSLIPFLAIRQVGRAMRNSAREAAVAEAVPKEHRGRQFGFINTLDTLGALAGPFLGLLILSYIATGTLALDVTVTSLQPFQVLFIVGAIPSVLATVIIWSRLRETVRPLPPGERRSFWKTLTAGTAAFTTNRRLLKYTLANALFALGALPMIMILAYLQLNNTGSWQTSLFLVTLLFAVYNIVHAVASYPAGWISDRFGRKSSQILADFLAVATFLAFALAPSPWMTIPGFILYGLFEALWITSRRSVVADLAAPEHRAHALGTFSMFYGLASFGAPLLFAAIWIFSSAQAAFLVDAIIVLTSAVILAYMVQSYE